MTTNLPAPLHPDASDDDLRAQVAELADINDQLFDLIEAQRAAYQKTFEDVLLMFAARGYCPAAQALVAIRRAFENVEPKATH